jgi:hypothetical protein
MKRVFLALVVLSLISVVPVASLEFSDLHVSFGKWELNNQRLYQKDLEAGMARIDIPAPQAGSMVYEFNVRYQDGGVEDLHGGFGVHIFVDEFSKGRAWGNGNSYLLWLNYDANPKGITKGFSAQVYKSTSHSRMELLADFDLNEYAFLLTEENMNAIIPVKMVVNGFTGDVKIYDPTDSTYVYKFNLGNTKALTGNFISLRTNSLGLSFGM